MTIELLTNSATIIAITIGVVEAVKRTDFLKDRFKSLFAIAVAIIVTFVSTKFSLEDWHLTLIQGLSVGLMSTGLFSTAKDTKESIAIAKEEPLG